MHAIAKYLNTTYYPLALHHAGKAARLCLAFFVAIYIAIVCMYSNKDREMIAVKSVVTTRVKLLPYPQSSARDSDLCACPSMVPPTLSLTIYLPKLVVELPRLKAISLFQAMHSFMNFDFYALSIF